MNLLILGQHPSAETFLHPLERAGFGITRWNGSPPAPGTPAGSRDFDWLVLLDPATLSEQAQVRVLRDRGINAPLMRIDLAAEQSLNIFRPVLAGVVERKRNGEKIHNCILTAKSAPHPEDVDPFGQIILEYHDPCGT